MSKRKRTNGLSFRPGNARITNSVFDYHSIENTARMYIKAIDNNRVYINERLYPFYGRALNLPENLLGEVVCKIKTIERETKMTMPEIAEEIKKVLGDILFFREDGSPLPSENIHKCIRAIKSKFPISIIKKFLYE